MIQITSAKGSKLGYVHHAAEFTIVLWKSGESITFVGPASVVFDKLIVDVDKSGVHCPKSLTKHVPVWTQIVSYLENNGISTVSSSEAYDNGYISAVDDIINGRLEDRIWLLDLPDNDPYFLGYMAVVNGLNPS